MTATRPTSAPDAADADSGAARRRSRVRAVVAVELALGLGLGVLMLAQAPVRGLLLAGLQAMFEGGRSTLRLLAVDTTGTALLLASILAQSTLVLAPLVRFFVTAAPWHRVWLVPLAFPVVFILGMMPASISTPLLWALLVAAGGVGFWAAGRPWLRALAFLPLCVSGEALIGHGPPRDLVWPPDRLFARCKQNDGERLPGLTPERTSLRYYALTRFRPELMLLTGARESYWLRRDANGRWDFEQPSRAQGELWSGAVVGDTIWFGEKFPNAMRLERTPDGHESVWREPVAPPWRSSAASNYEDVMYDPDSHEVYTTANLGGALHRFDPATRTLRQVHLGGINPHLARRDDGRLAGATTAELIVFDPRAEVVTERLPAGLALTDVSLCGVDGELAVADIAGRVRVFERGGADGRYAFSRGLRLPAPRRVDHSPDCRHLAVTSGDDTSVWLVRADTLEVVKRWRVGPALRDVRWIDDTTFAAVDGCGPNLFRVE